MDMISSSWAGSALDYEEEPCLTISAKSAPGRVFVKSMESVEIPVYTT
jgi:hypothetical protein